MVGGWSGDGGADTPRAHTHTQTFVRECMCEWVECAGDGQEAGFSRNDEDSNRKFSEKTDKYL